MPEGDDSILKLFVSIGLNEQKAKETLKNEALANDLQALISEVSTNPWSRQSCYSPQTVGQT